MKAEYIYRLTRLPKRLNPSALNEHKTYGRKEIPNTIHREEIA